MANEEFEELVTRHYSFGKEGTRLMEVPCGWFRGYHDEEYIGRSTTAENIYDWYICRACGRVLFLDVSQENVPPPRVVGYINEKEPYVALDSLLRLLR